MLCLNEPHLKCKTLLPLTFIHNAKLSYYWYYKAAGFELCHTNFADSFMEKYSVSMLMKHSTKKSAYCPPWVTFRWIQCPTEIENGKPNGKNGLNKQDLSCRWISYSEFGKLSYQFDCYLSNLLSEIRFLNLKTKRYSILQTCVDISN